MTFHTNSLSEIDVKTTNITPVEPCHDVAHLNQHRRQAKLQRFFLGLMTSNLIVLGIFLINFVSNQNLEPSQSTVSVAEAPANNTVDLTAKSAALSSDVNQPSLNENPNIFPMEGMTLADEERALTQLYDKAEGAVVKVVVARQGQVDLSRPEATGDGNGSGIFLDSEGHIVTNNHVVADATDVVVQFGSGVSLPAEIVGQDIETDLAVLQIDVSTITFNSVPLADSDSLQVGQVAIAIGYPFGLDKSLTVGHISGLNRDMRSGDRYNPLMSGIIQTDAAINPGNSGGPLFNLQGQVVGINTAIFSTSRGSQGIGFAIPSNAVRQVANELIDRGYVSRPFLGIFGLALNEQRAALLEVEIDRGLLIQDLAEGSPGLTAGLQAGNRWGQLFKWPVRLGGDVLLAINDDPVDSMPELSALLQTYAIGDEIIMTVFRDGQVIELAVVIGERPA